MRSRFINKRDVENLARDLGKAAWLPFRVMLETGLRVGDVCKLRRSDVQRREDERPVLHFVADKTGKEGFAPISEGLYGALIKEARRRGGYLFPGREKGSHITRQALYARIKRSCADLGIDPRGISPHSLRKVFAVNLRHERGLEAVREALQHDNAAVTRVYAYADTVLQSDSDEPIRWRDLELLVDYILERLHEKGC